MAHSPPFGLTVIGCGPAGLAPLVALGTHGRLHELLSEGVCLVEKGPALGAGRLGDYVIRSDSRAAAFLSCVTDNKEPAIAALASSPEFLEIARSGDDPVPLTLVSAFQRKIGSVLGELVVEAGGEVCLEHTAIEARRRGSQWEVVTCDAAGRVRSHLTQALVLATGARQPEARLFSAQVAGSPLLPRLSGKLVQSDELLSTSGFEAIRRRLSALRAPRVAIIGGSTSALASAIVLLDRAPELTFGIGDVTLFHRRPLRVFYPSPASARADGYDEFGEDDICPVSGFVFRLAGFRQEARDLAMRMLRIGGRVPDPRLRLVSLPEEAPESVWRCLDEADLVVAAMGYTPNALPLRLRDGSGIALRTAADRGLPLVDDLCRVRDQDGGVVEDVFAIGLAAGFVPSGRLGGEKSFVGQANGLWLWQHDVGVMIGEAALSARREEHVA